MIKESKRGEECRDALSQQASSLASPSLVLPWINELKEELSCAICLEICFEPSATLCGHSFCKDCLKSVDDNWGRKCPKCQKLISYGESCTLHIVLWNTIQLLFPQEVEARKKARDVNCHESEPKSTQNILVSRVSSTTANLRAMEPRTPHLFIGGLFILLKMWFFGMICAVNTHGCFR